MTQQLINIGTVADDNTGDPLRTAGGKINDNTTELYGRTSDFESPANYGLIADGGFHSLSERYATLAEAQAVYPFATSLVQQIDYCAVKAASNAAFGPDLIYNYADFDTNGNIFSASGTVITLSGTSFAVDELIGQELFLKRDSDNFILSAPIASNTATVITTVFATGVGSSAWKWAIGYAEHGSNFLLNRRLFLPAGRYNFLYDTWTIRNLGSGVIEGSGRLATTIIGSNGILYFDGIWYSHLSNFGVQLQQPSSALWTNNTAYFARGETYQPSIVYDPIFELTYMCMADHTSAAAGTFDDDLLARPGIWQQMHAYGAMSVDGSVFGQGNWEPNIPYIAGYRVYDSVGGGRYLCRVTHTSGAGTFAADRAADPDHWVIYNNRGVQGVTLNNLFIDGGNTPFALTMTPQGGSSGQGSECAFINLHLSSTTFACYAQYGFNALANVFIGGNCQTFTKHGIFVVSGYINVYGTGFQSTSGYRQIENGGADIHLGESGAFDGVTIYGCRTESLRFLYAGSAVRCHVSCCTSRVALGGWVADASYSTASNPAIVVAAGDATGRLFRVVTDGVSGSIEPTWPIFNSAAWDDPIDEATLGFGGTVVWKAVWYDAVWVGSGTIDTATVAMQAGFISGAGIRDRALRIITTDTDLYNDEMQVVLVDCTSGAVTLTLPPVQGVTENIPPVVTAGSLVNGVVVTVKKVDTTSNAVTINSLDRSFETGGTSYTLPGGARSHVTFMSGQGAAGSNQWLILDRHNETRSSFATTSTAGETGLLLYDVDNATAERVTVGAADSGGAGFKLLRIPN